MPPVGLEYVCDVNGCGARIEDGRGVPFRTVTHDVAIVCSRCGWELEREREQEREEATA